MESYISRVGELCGRGRRGKCVCVCVSGEYVYAHVCEVIEAYLCREQLLQGVTILFAFSLQHRFLQRHNGSAVRGHLHQSLQPALQLLHRNIFRRQFAV